MSEAHPIAERPWLEGSHLEDLKLAATKMRGEERRSFQAEMARKYCGGNPRQAEVVFGWNRHTVEVGLHEQRTGLICRGAHEAFCGNKRWEDRHPEVAEALWGLAESHAQQDPSFRTALAYTRLTAAEALKQLRDRGFADAVLPSPSTMADVLNRKGYRLRPVVKAKPQKIPETDAIFDNIQAKDPGGAESTVMRLSMDCKATVKIGDYSRGGRTRGDNQALDHDMGCQEQYTPFGVVNEDTGALHLTFGGSAKTSDFIVDGLHAWWEHQAPEQRDACSLLQIKADNGPESSGRRTRFLKRMVDFADHIGKPIQLLYYPPYHSKYNPVERCWGILEQHWNGAKLVDVQTMLEWAQSMTWQGIHPAVELSRKLYKKGISLSKETMQAVEARLERHPELPKWDILIRPACMV